MHVRPFALLFLVTSLVGLSQAAPVNDNFAQRNRIAGEYVKVRATTVDATVEPGEPGTFGDGSVWFSWIAPHKGTYEFSLSAENNVYMEVFTGKSFPALMWLPGVSSPRAILRLQGGEPYQVRIISTHPGGLDFEFRIRQVKRPRNDDFDHAIPFAGTNTSVQGTVRNATQDHGGLMYAVGMGNVWYRWEAPGDGLYLASTISERSSMSLSIYEGPSADLLQFVDVPVNGIRTGSSFYAQATSNYWISVSGYNAESSRFELSVSAVTPPPNDLFENSIAVSGGEVSIEGNSLGARRDPFEPYTSFFAQEFVWYSWTAPTAGLYRIAASLVTSPSTNGSPGAPRPPFTYNWLVISTGSALTSQVEVVRGEASIGGLLRADAGVTYHVAVPGRMSSFAFKITPTPPEPNDDYVNATALNDIFAASGSTLNATPEPGYPYSNRSVWYRWSAPSNGFYAIAIAANGAGASSMNQSISIYKGEDFATAEYVPEGTPVLRAVAGEEFHIGVSPTPPLPGGAFIFRIEAVTPPSNDDFANSEVLAGTNVTFVAQVRNATIERDEPGSQTVWYTWTTPLDGLYALRFLTNSGYVRVFTGSPLNNLNEIASGYPEVFFEASDGLIFHFSVDAQHNRITDLPLELRKVPVPSNDDFANRIILAGSSISTTGTLAGATLEPDDPAQNGFSGRSIWWSWTAPANGRARIDFNPSGSLRTLVYTGDTIESLQFVTAGFSLDLFVEAGITYQIAVTGDENEPFPFNITMLEAPPNDAFAQRRRLIRRGRGTTVGASREVGERYYENDRLGASVWWKWRAPRHGVYDLAIRGAATVAVIYTGNQLEELEPLHGIYNPATDIRLRARAGTTYVIEVSNPSGLSGDYELEMIRRPSPHNDDFARRSTLIGTNITVLGRNEFASREPDEPDYSYCDRPRRTVWWKWTAPATGTAFIQFEQGVRKCIGVYQGNQLTELQVLAGNNQDIHFDVRAGVEYQIGVDSLLYADTPDPWQFQLRFVPSPVNDEFTSRGTLTGAVIRATGTSVGATVEEGEPTSIFQHSVWWSWTAPATGRYTVRASSTNDWLTMSLWKGDSLATLEIIAYADSFRQTSEINLPFLAGDQISIRMDNPIATPDDFFTLDVYAVDPPANDNFADRAALIEGRGTNSNEGATSEVGEPGMVFDPHPNSLWWRFTAASSGWHTVTTPFPLAGGVQFFTGDNLTNLMVVNPSNQYAEWRWALTAGVEYAIQVVNPENRLGVVQIEVLYHPPPANDAFANAATLAGDHAVAMGSNTWATGEPGEPPGPAEVPNSVWWRWTPAGDGYYLLLLNQSVGTKFPDVFTGSSVSNLVPASGGIYATYESYLFRAQGGVEHFIRVGSGGNSEGAILLQLDRVEPPPNDDFSNRTLLAGSHISLLASNYYATPEPNDPLTATFGGQSVWWRWVAPASGTANLDFTGGLYGGVFRGDALTNLVPVSVIGSMSPQSFAVEAGVEYAIGLTTWFYAASEFTLTLDAPEPAPSAAISLPLPTGILSGITSVIETSTNLVHWEPFRTNHPGETIVPIAPRSDEPQRYFRVR